MTAPKNFRMNKECPRHPLYVYTSPESRIVVRPIPGGGEGARGWEMGGERLPVGGDPAAGWAADEAMPACGPMPMYEALHLAQEWATAQSQLCHAQAEAHFGPRTFTRQYREALMCIWTDLKRQLEAMPDPEPRTEPPGGRRHDVTIHASELDNLVKGIQAALKERKIDASVHVAVESSPPMNWGQDGSGLADPGLNFPAGPSAHRAKGI